MKFTPSNLQLELENRSGWFNVRNKLKRVENSLDLSITHLLNGSENLDL